MHMMNWIRGGMALGLGLVLAGCGGPESQEANTPELGAVQQGINKVANSGFEAAPPGSYNYTVLTTGATTLTNWTVGGSIKVMHSTYKTPNSGTKSIDLNGYGAGSIEQTISTVPGNGYTVRFYVALPPSCTGTRNATLTYGPSTASVSNSLPGWTLRTYVFTATTASTLIKLQSTSSGVSCGLAIDDFTVDGP
ncbi:DUF642 domain-containing protein [Corallococcus praedator]|uniref:DUF642 domain-containing protein n=2 Tax=Myxococcaceae TaxID=31 RepID=A0ABX9QQG3_9BACT|nr:DUF642 domain-containing protein [Corallococcus sp. CA031C]RKI16720.1 DUF642 domain-containing protein [Corallococcus praedator]